MRHAIFLSTLITILFQCTSEDRKYSVERYLNEQEADTLLADVATFVYYREGIPANKRFEKKYRGFYVSEAKRFEFDQYHVSGKDSSHYFLLIRPARNTKGKLRSVAGKMKLNEAKQIIEFEEYFVSPLMDKKEIEERSRFLWREWIKNGNIDNYLNMKSYIEWPNQNTVYDKQRHEWTSKKLLD